MKKRIMVVDDSRMVAMQLKSILKDTDFEIVAYCADGETALEMYKEVHPDLVTMDIVMPGMDGLEAARILREKHPHARVVMLSSLLYDGSLDEARAIGAKAFLSKPFDPEQVLAALEKATADI